MKGLKESLIEKAQIIQIRNDNETANYQRGQVEFQQHQETMTAEEYRNFCNEALFRIRILERRLNKVDIICKIRINLMYECSIRKQLRKNTLCWTRDYVLASAFPDLYKH
jgi:hypothetical protein